MEKESNGILKLSGQEFCAVLIFFDAGREFVFYNWKALTQLNRKLGTKVFLEKIINQIKFHLYNRIQGLFRSPLLSGFWQLSKWYNWQNRG